ncbi:HIT-like domain-containing protein [Aspergillus californicus]
MPPSTACAFCKIAAAYLPIPTSTFLPNNQHSSSPSSSSSTPSIAIPGNTGPGSGSDSHAFLILSTKHVLAFLDIMPLTQGHVLVVPREHSEKLGEVGVRVSRELGTWLPIISRAIMRTVFGKSESDSEDEDAHIEIRDRDRDVEKITTDDSWNWNVVQNNGPGAAQVVPHVHFHIVPRPPLGAASTKAKMSFVMFGRGQREDLDDEEAEKFAGVLRACVAKEVARVREVEGIDVEEDFEVGGGSITGGKGRL